MTRALSALLAAVAALALTTADDFRRFRFERDIVSPGTGPARLPADVPLLAGGRPFTTLRASTPIDGETRYVAEGGLADLRLFDSSGREVPYLLVYAPAPQPSWAAATQVLPLAETRRTSGFEADFGEAAPLDAIRVNGLPAPLLKRLMLEGSGDREHWTMLLAGGTLFDLPSERMRQMALAFPAGAYRYLRVTWNDTDSGRVPMPGSVDARRVERAAPAPALRAAVAVEQRPSEPGKSRYRLRLPGTRLPIVALRVNVNDPRVMREAAVTEARLSGAQAVPIELGRATLRRVVRDTTAAESLRVPISAPLHAQLDLVVDNGNNPPLHMSGVSAEFAELPFVYFESTGNPIVARFGDRRLDAPRYDLEAARDGIRIESVPEARWGEPRAVTPQDISPARAAVPQRGATIDPASFKVLRAIPGGEPGLASLELDAPVLAQSQGPGRSFGDVRIIDASGHQVPYLLERRDEPQVLDLQLRRTELPGGMRASNLTAYAVDLPFAGLPASRLVLTAGDEIFSRRVIVGAERRADRRHRDDWFEDLYSADWRHDDRAGEAASLVVPLPPSPPPDLRVIVDEGDNAPLALTGARLLLPAYRVRFYRAEGAGLRLAYGRTDLAAPEYDLQLLAGEVLGDVARDVRALPAPRADAAATAAASLISPRVFWGVLAAAVLVLLALLTRLIARS